MYSLTTALTEVSGVGAVLAEKLAENSLFTVKNLLLQVPLRYEDRSKMTTIDQLVPGELMTVEATLDTISQFRKNGKLIISASASDETGKLKLMWFNVAFIIKSLKKGETYVISGKIGKTGIMSHPTLERAHAESVHTNRIVPLYTTSLDFKQGTLRRLLKHICDNLDLVQNEIDRCEPTLLPLTKVLQTLHFPDAEEEVVEARSRLALEELVALILLSEQIKKDWHSNRIAISLEALKKVPKLPFSLTGAQKRCVSELVGDLGKTVPMNRLLLGDVGSGKTVVAGLGMLTTTNHGAHAALVAPTQMLAEQHAQTLSKLFPKETILVVTGKGVKIFGDGAGNGELQKNKKLVQVKQPSLIVGTHAVLNFLQKQEISFPLGLIVYDEQHRFGVEQRSQLMNYQNPDGTTPHTLTMTATPIPRSLMLTIFSHLQLSVIDELPANRIPTKSWLLTEKKRTDSYDWCCNLIEQGRIAKQSVITLVVCPFIDQSESEAFSHIPSATVRYEELKAYYKKQKLRIELLHGRQTAKVKDEIIKKLYANEIDILVTTPIVEVGIDLPQASIMVIEAAERFGLATLHQLRGRVGRAGQQGYCLLFTSKPPATIQKHRLELFSTTLNGQKLAEYDLEHRGAGDLFGTDQSGFEQLHFASWSDHELIHQAQTIAAKLHNIEKPDILFNKYVTDVKPTVGGN